MKRRQSFFMRFFLSILQLANALLTTGLLVLPVPLAFAADERSARVCYSTAETREQIAQSALLEPFGVMRAEAKAQQAEAIGVKLCRVNDVYVYEIDLLRRDGRLLHARLDAQTGKPLAENKRRE